MNESTFVWLGTESGLASYLETLRACMAKYGTLSGTRVLLQDDSEEDPNPVGYDVIGNLAVISLNSSTVSKSNWMTRLFGIASYQDIKDRFLEAADDRNVKGVLFNIDTNGGHAEGVKSTADFIRAFNNTIKPVVTFTDAKALSAGYWMAAGGQKIVADEGARVGSIGALMVHMEYTDQMKEAGVKATVFRSAPYKALGTPYEKLTDKATEELKREIAYWHDVFANGIAQLRGLEPDKVQKTIANGRVYRSEEAITFGMIDSILSYEEVVAKLNSALEQKPNPATAV